VRTFLETDADLVVVSLPTSKFVLFIVERWEVDAARLAEALAAPQTETSLRLRSAVDTTTLCRLYWGLALEALPTGRDTVVALRLDLGRGDVTECREGRGAPALAQVERVAVVRRKVPATTAAEARGGAQTHPSC
jgi:hypothetical protein